LDIQHQNNEKNHDQQPSGKDMWKPEKMVPHTDDSRFDGIGYGTGEI
jgi:hypothetical protein